MSYCRWSSLNWMSDVYCYEDVNGGWTTHVASNRRVREPKPGDLDIRTAPAREWAEAHRKTMADLDTIPLEPIGLPYDGAHFNDDTLQGFRATLTMLKDAGYIVPDYVFEVIDEEIRERDE